MLSIVATV